jgi:hypothetical protein
VSQESGGTPSDEPPWVELVAEIGDRQIESLLPLGEPFLVDGEDPRPKRASWSGGPKRRAPHLVDAPDETD